MATAVRSMALSQNLHNIMLGKQRPLAPAPKANGVLSGHRANAKLLGTGGTPAIGSAMGNSKKYTYCALPYATPQQSASVQRRNARERNRVKQVNNGFANLRQHIPPNVVTALTNGARGGNKKLSKVDTLRLAVEYIRSLQRMLDEKSGSICSASSGGYTYYGTMSEQSNASSPTPSQLSDHSSQDAAGGRYAPIGGGFKHEPYDVYADPSSSPTPSDHGIAGVTSSSSVPLHAGGHSTVLGTSADSNHYTIEQQQQQQHLNHPHHTPLQFKTELHDNAPYEEEMSPQNPDDEELLDYISWWQQQ